MSESKGLGRKQFFFQRFFPREIAPIYFTSDDDETKLTLQKAVVNFTQKGGDGNSVTRFGEISTLGAKF